MTVTPPAQTLTALLQRQSANTSPLLYDREQPLSYADLIAQADRVAAGLLALGVAPGDRVAIWLPNVPAWLACFFGCARIGAIAVAVNTRFRAHELADIIARSGSRVLVYWPGFTKVDFDAVLGGCPPESLAGLSAIVEYAEAAPAGGAHTTAASAAPAVPRIGYRALCERQPDAAALAAALQAGTADAGCAIFTTSGTTRAPKFVLHNQRTLVAHARQVVDGFGLGPDSLLLLAPPLCGVFGVCSALAMIAAGRPFVMTPVWDAAQAAASIDRLGVTHLNGTDDSIAQLLACNERTPAFPTLRFVGFAAFTPSLADIVERADRRGLTVLGLYGISEIQALFARQSEHASPADRMLAGGRPVSAQAQVRCRDPETGQLLAHGQAGELEFLAPSSRMVEYFGDPQATAAAITADGWYRSGDLGHTQADGRFVYLTRMGDTLRLGGFLTSPAEIENAVQAVPGICGCQVVGVPIDGVLRPVAFVTLEPGAATSAAGQTGEAAIERRVVDTLQPLLARYKVPARVFVTDAFPVTEGTNATKIQKHRLRDLAQSRLATG